MLFRCATLLALTQEISYQCKCFDTGKTLFTSLPHTSSASCLAQVMQNGKLGEKEAARQLKAMERDRQAKTDVVSRNLLQLR